MILNVGCGGRSHHKGSNLGDVRIDIFRFPPVTFLMDAHHLAFKNATFSKIVSFEVLEHLESPTRALREFHRVLRQDGEIIITVPNVWYWRRIFRHLMNRRKALAQSDRKQSWAHKQAWDIQEFLGLADQANLRVTEVRWLDWYSKERLKLKHLDALLRPIPEFGCTHVMFKLRSRTRASNYKVKVGNHENSEV